MHINSIVMTDIKEESRKINIRTIVRDCELLIRKGFDVSYKIIGRIMNDI